MHDPHDSLAQELKQLSERLHDDGYDVQRLKQLELSVVSLKQPPTVVGRLRNSIRETFRQQSALLALEFVESKEALTLVRSAISGSKLSDSERDKVKSQMVDLLKLLPAGVVAVANAAIPLPGMALLTPWLLRKLHLLPSRWREAHLLAELQKEHTALLEAGYRDSAELVLNLRGELERVVQQRRAADRDTQLLAHWDSNNHGVWGESERNAYDAEVAELNLLAQSHGHLRRWFLSTGGAVFGPVRLEELQAETPTGNQLSEELPGSPSSLGQALTLVCYDGKSGWVDLNDVVSTNALEADTVNP